MAFSISKYASMDDPEFEGIEQIKTESIIGVPHFLNFVRINTKKDGTYYAKVCAKFDDGRIAWYYTASVGLVGTLRRALEAEGYIPSDAKVQISELDTGKGKKMLIYKDA